MSVVRMELNKRALLVVLGDEVAAKTFGEAIAGQLRCEPAEQGTELALVQVVKRRVVALEALLAQRTPYTPFQSLGLADNRNLQNATHVVRVAVDDAGIACEHRARLALFLWQRAVAGGSGEDCAGCSRLVFLDFR